MIIHRWPRVLLAVLAGLLGLGLAAAGAAIIWAQLTLRGDDGFYASRQLTFASTGSAVVVEDAQVDVGVRPGTGRSWLSDLASVRIEAVPQDSKPIFVGIARQSDLDRYLLDVPHDQVFDIRPDWSVETRTVSGTATPQAPVEQGFWAAYASGLGAQELSWPVEDGRWAVVLMNADGSAGVSVLGSAAGQIRYLTPVAVGLLGLGTLALLVAAAAVVSLVREPVLGPFGPVAAGQPHPLSLTARVAPHPSRWLWLVKWLLVVPHAVVLAGLWLAFVGVTVVAWFAILFTGRYPRSLFDFNVGVLRWSWRVGHYGYLTLGTDRYPPFTLAPTDYPASLDVRYPERLSRPMVLVKWLLVVPHLAIVAVLAGTARGFQVPGLETPVDPTVGLLGVLILVVAGYLVLGLSYPRGLFDLLVGLNRWVFRVTIYVALMTDVYPPFRLDLGGEEPRPEQPAAPVLVPEPTGAPV